MDPIIGPAINQRLCGAYFLTQESLLFRRARLRLPLFLLLVEALVFGRVVVAVVGSSLLVEEVVGSSLLVEAEVVGSLSP